VKRWDRSERTMRMTMKWRAVAALFLITAVALAGAASDAGADYIGDFCWVVDFGGGIPTIMQFGVSLAGPHVALTGRTNAFGVIVPVSGSAEVVGSEIRIQYTFSSPGGPGGLAAQSYVFESGLMVLNSSLNGTVQMIDTRRNGVTGSITQTFLTATARPVACTP